MSISIQPVLMSGGAGTRLWPLSRKRKPKQFARMLGERTLFQDTVLRVSGEQDGLRFLPPIVVGAASHASLLQEQLAAIGASGARVVLEPAPRNTAPCAAAAAALVAARAPETLILLLPCDHVIRDTAALYDGLRRGAAAAASGYIVTFGIAPSGPETAYGYIKAGEPLGQAFRVRRFAEKPDAATAQAYLDEGGWTWNAGIFLFRASTMILELERHAPDILASVREALDKAREKDGVLRLDPAAFEACRSESIDYAVAEKTAAAAVAPVDMGWSDVGLWSAVWDMAEKDESGVAATGDVIAVDSRDCLAISDGPTIALAGVGDLVVVAQDGVILVTRRDASASVKTLVEKLKSQGRDTLL